LILKLLNKNSNFLLFLFFLTLLLLSHSFEKISTDITTILPQNREKELIKEFREFQTTKEILLCVKGFDNSSLYRIKKLEEKLCKIEGISLKKSLYKNKELQKYLQKYQFFLKDFKKTRVDIEKKLQIIYENMINSSYYLIDTNDPLNLFSLNDKEFIKTKNFHTIIEDYGYFTIFEVSSKFKSIKDYQKIYNSISKNVEENDDIKLFSPLFYFAQNSLHIKKEVNTILFISLTILLILYLFLLRNFLLFLNTIATLATSMIIGILIVTTIFSEVSIFILVFAMAISSVAIDYMFHHYFHTHYEKQKGFNKEVFYGFLTTILVFVLFAFVDFPLISQLSIFTIVSLSSSYLMFAFLYPMIQFQTKERKIFSIKSYFYFDKKYLFVVSIVFIFISLKLINLDFDIKKLDYQNHKLNNIENFFRSKLHFKNHIPAIIKANSIDKLIQINKEIKKISPNSITLLSKFISQKEYNEKISTFKEFNFKLFKKELNEKANKLGFRKDFFKNSYSNKILYPKPPKYSIEKLKKLGFDIIEKNGYYISTISIDKKDIKSFANKEYIKVISLKELFINSIKKSFNQLLYSGIFALFIIFVMIFIATKEIITPFTFLTFPLSLILLYSIFFELNIMNIFMIFVIIAISIDYGIYISLNNSTQTKKAVSFSLISTFVGFGVLVFSDIFALYCIGITATIGIIAILFLLLITKKKE